MQGRHIQLFNRLDALEIIHRTPNDSTKSILILDEEDHVDINNLHDKNIEYNTLLNVCYTVCKTLKENIRFVYLPLSKSLFDKAWPKLIKKEWKGICFTSDILSFGLANPLSDVIGCFFKADGHKCVLSVPLKGTLGTFTKGSGGPNTLGFFLKDLVQIASKPFHSLAPIKEPKIRMINTLDKFKKFISILRDLKIVSIDTETSGLNRITSPLLMVQFAVSNELCYCLPMSGHNESPWNDKELRYIKKYLRNYFSTTKSLHIMHAASFDIGQLMHHFNVKYYSANIYDTIAGEFLIDELKKFLRTKSFKPYALETVELEYGLIRPKGLIEKDQRKNMAAFTLEQIAEYGSYDVITLFDIRERQLQSCIHKLVGYKSIEEYERTVIKQVGVMNRVFSTMQNNGMEINVDYLMELVSPVGPLENQKKEIIKKLFTLPSVLKLNRRLKKRAGHSENTLFGDEVRLFNINKPAHKHELFFDILGLEPVSFGKALDENGEPKPSTDKAFQAHYAKDVPEVASLTDYNKVTKLKSAFADAIMERIIQDSDFIEDGRLRSSYGFSSVLSGRCIHKDSMVAVLDDRQNVPIKDIKVGDWVWSYNFDTLRPEPKQVLNVYDNGKRPTIKIKYTKKHPKAKQDKYLICTPDHKIGILNKSYKKAENLDYGDRLIAFERFYSDNNHTYKGSKNNGIAHVYDIEVEDNHNFFANGILVHNCNAFNINPQQIPSRGPLAKVIKKLFKSKLGRILIASDFSAHEVRIGGIVSRDPMVAKVFNAANEAIREFRLKKILPEEYAAAKELLERKGDIHIMNCLTGDTLINTSKGVMRLDSIGELSVDNEKIRKIKGLKVEGKNGLADVTHWMDRGIRSVINVETDSNSLVLTKDHEVLTFNGTDLVWKKAGSLTNEDYLVSSKKELHPSKNIKIQRSSFKSHFNDKLIKYPSKMSASLSRLLAMIISEGSVFQTASGNYNIIVTNTNLKYLNEANDLFKLLFGVEGKLTNTTYKNKANKDCFTLTISSKALFNFIRDLGLYSRNIEEKQLKKASHFVTIPDVIMQGTREVKLAFIQAYLEGDGHISNAGKGIRLLSASKNIHKQFAVILQSFGISSSFRTDKTCCVTNIRGQSAEHLRSLLNSNIKNIESSYKNQSSIRIKKDVYVSALNKAKILEKEGVTTFKCSNGEELSVRNFKNIPSSQKFISLDSKWSYFKKWLNVLEAVDKNLYETFCSLNKYNYERVITLKDAGKERVYDLSTSEKEEPSFHANGFIVHNCKFFYGLDIDKKHVLRDQIKSVVFGVLYGKMAKNLAKAMSIEEEEAQALLDKLFENWSGVKKWIDHVHETANETFMVHYPNHRVRHMWGYLSSDKWVHFAMNRRAVNSPIQGFASDIGVVAIDELNRWIHENIWLRDYEFDFQTINMIHDAQYNETAFESLPLGVYLTEHAMSSLPMDYYKREFGYKISIPLGYDLDFGLNWADLKEWDKRAESLFDMIGKLGQETGKDATPVIEDAKKIMKIRTQELRENPYKRLITPQNCSEFWDTLDMFKKAA